MAISRVTTWNAGDVLTASALNTEFNNIIDNAHSLVNPLTADLNFNGSRLTGLHAGTVGSPSLSWTADSDTGFWASAANTVDLSTGGLRNMQWAHVSSAVTYLKMTDAATGNPYLMDVVSTDTDSGITISAQAAGVARLRSASGNVALRSASTDMLTVTGVTSVDMGTNKPFIPSAVSGTPAQHALHRENVVKGWANITVTGGTPSVNDSYNVTSITDTAGGQVTVTWDRDFANSTYVAHGTCSGGSFFGVVGTMATGSVRIDAYTDAGANSDPGQYFISAIGDQ